MHKLLNQSNLWLVLALLGLVLPLYFVIQFFIQAGQVDWNVFLATAFANLASTALIVDFMIVLVAFVVWMVPEARRLRMRHWWVYVLLLGYVSAACAIPLFLFMRARRLQALQAEANSGAKP